MKKNDVCSFMIYMANKWSKEECEKVFEGYDYNHFWNKWCRIYKTHGAMGAIPYFFLELSYEYQDLLVKRSTECYDRRIEIIEESKMYEKRNH